MTSFDWIMVILTVMSVIAIPLLVFAIRGAVKWTRTEGQVMQLIATVRELVQSKEGTDKKLTDGIKEVVSEQTSVHREMYEQMRVDREATDKRLRFIEEYWMQSGQKRKRK